MLLNMTSSVSRKHSSGLADIREHSSRCSPAEAVSLPVFSDTQVLMKGKLCVVSVLSWALQTSLLPVF